MRAASEGVALDVRRAQASAKEVTRAMRRRLVALFARVMMTVMLGVEAIGRQQRRLPARGFMWPW
jgi:hypothetical protein